MRSLAAALFEHEAIITTRPKAKEVQRFAERLITVAKRGQNGGSKLASRRLVASRLQDEQVAKKLCEEIAPRFAGRAGGYTRIVKLGKRMSDSSEMCILEWVDFVPKAPKARKEKAEEAPKAEKPAKAAKKEKPAKKEKKDKKDAK